MYGLVERTVKGDGNCQFRALADQLYRTADMHADVRRAVVHQLRARSEVPPCLACRLVWTAQHLSMPMFEVGAGAALQRVRTRRLLAVLLGHGA